MSEHATATTARRAFTPWMFALDGAFVAAGVAAFVLGLRSPETAARAWAMLLVNVLFWATLAQSGVVWAATLRLCRTRWSAVFSRLGDACVAFLPLSLIPVALLLALGQQQAMPWLATGVGDRGVWLNMPFVTARDLGGLALMTLLSILYVRRHLQVDLGKRSAESVRGGNAALSVAIPLAFSVVYSFIAFDLVMSLVPGWFSTLIGWYFMAGGMYCAMATLIIMAIFLRRRLGWEAQLSRQRWLDAANLQMAFGMATTYMFFSQLLPIWYENMPHETSYLVARYNFEPWRLLSYGVLVGAYLGPFALNLITELKWNPRTLQFIAGLVLLGMLLERYLLVMPSLIPRERLAFGLMDVLIIVGFKGLFALSVGWFVNRYPMLSTIDLGRAAALAGESSEDPPVSAGESVEASDGGRA